MQTAMVHNVSPFPSNNRIPTWPEIDTTASHFVTLQERHIFGANLINIATFSFNRPNDGGSNNTQMGRPLKFDEDFRRTALERLKGCEYMRCATSIRPPFVR